MKTILSCCLVIILAVSCQMKQKQNQNSDDSIAENMSVDGTETCIGRYGKGYRYLLDRQSRSQALQRFGAPYD